MRKLSALIVFAALLVGCGDKQEEAPAPSPAQAEATPDPDLEGYSEGVKKYYGEVHSEPTGDEDADVEAEYHQPPEAGRGRAGRDDHADRHEHRNPPARDRYRRRATSASTPPCG